MFKGSHFCPKVCGTIWKLKNAKTINNLSSCLSKPCCPCNFGTKMPSTKVCLKKRTANGPAMGILACTKTEWNPFTKTKNQICWDIFLKHGFLFQNTAHGAVTLLLTAFSKPCKQIHGKIYPQLFTQIFLKKKIYIYITYISIYIYSCQRVVCRSQAQSSNAASKPCFKAHVGHVMHCVMSMCMPHHVELAPYK